jgi:hypothetical protein
MTLQPLAKSFDILRGRCSAQPPPTLPSFKQNPPAVCLDMEAGILTSIWTSYPVLQTMDEHEVHQTAAICATPAGRGRSTRCTRHAAQIRRPRNHQHHLQSTDKPRSHECAMTKW